MAALASARAQGDYQDPRNIASTLLCPGAWWMLEATQLFLLLDRTQTTKLKNNQKHHAEEQQHHTKQDRNNKLPTLERGQPNNPGFWAEVREGPFILRLPATTVNHLMSVVRFTLRWTKLFPIPPRSWTGVATCGFQQPRFPFPPEPMSAGGFSSHAQQPPAFATIIGKGFRLQPLQA